jgi:hypothetical protein
VVVFTGSKGERMNGGNSTNSFFGALFDFSFSSFVTTKIIKVLYVLAIIGVTIWSLILIFGGITQGGTAALFGIVGGLLGFFLGIIYARVLLEFIVIVFRIAENTAVIARSAQGGGGYGGGSVPGGPPAGPPGGPSGGAPSGGPGSAPPPPSWGTPPGGSNPGQSGGGPLGPPPAGPIGNG